MGNSQSSANWAREELLSLLSICGTLAGLCITIVALMNTFYKAQASASVIDDAFAFCAAGFLLCIYLIFWALRTRRTAIVAVLLRVVDGLFLLALTSMTIAGFAMIYTVWFLGKW